MNFHDPVLDHRARLERAQREASERRTQSIVDQRSPSNTPEARVRAWEKLHQVRLPKDPDHVVLVLVAQQTGMPLAEVQEVQRQRIAPAA